MADACTGRDPGRRILLVEDDPTNQYVFRTILESAGYTVEIAENGLVALDRLVRFRPHLILLDMMMPVMDGYETAARLCGDPDFDRIPILALTAKAMRGDEDRSIEAGCDDYMAKPVNRQTLLDRIDLWLENPPQGWVERRRQRRDPPARSA